MIARLMGSIPTLPPPRTRRMRALDLTLARSRTQGSAPMNPSMCRTMSTLCFLAGLASIIGSIAVWYFLDRGNPETIAHAERFGIFIGLWAPTLLILSNRFDRYADKARLLPGLDPKLHETADEA